MDEREFESRQAGDRQQAHDFIEDDGMSPRNPTTVRALCGCSPTAVHWAYRL